MHGIVLDKYHLFKQFPFSKVGAWFCITSGPRQKFLSDVLFSAVALFFGG